MQVKVLLLMVCLTCSICPSSAGDFDFLGVLNSLLKLESGIASAIAQFEKWAEDNKGVALTTIENYTNKSHLTLSQIVVVSGEINKVTGDIIGGSKDALSSRGPTCGQSEGLIGWSLPQEGLKLVAYWRVAHKRSVFCGQKSNKLGLGFLTNVNETTEWLKDHFTTEKDQVLPSLGVRDYSSDLETLQCCHGDLCVQGIMTNSHKCNITIRLLPKRARDIFYHSSQPVDEQQYLDQALDLPSTCSSSSSGASSVTSSVTLGLLTILALSIYHSAVLFD